MIYIIPGTININVTIKNNSLAFSEFAAAMTLDAATTITNPLAGNLTIDLTSTGDFVIADNSVPYFTFGDTGTLTQAGSGQVTMRPLTTPILLALLTVILFVPTSQAARGDRPRLRLSSPLLKA